MIKRDATMGNGQLHHTVKQHSILLAEMASHIMRIKLMQKLHYHATFCQ